MSLSSTYLSQSLDVGRFEIFGWKARVNVGPVAELIVFDTFFLFILEDSESFSGQLSQ